jgi:hypothetical protein
MLGVRHSTGSEHLASPLAESASEEHAERTRTTQHGTEATLKTGAIEAGQSATTTPQAAAPASAAPAVPALPLEEQEADDAKAEVASLVAGQVLGCFLKTCTDSI